MGKQNTSVEGCQPVYECVCDLDMCTVASVECTLPQVAVEVETDCCNKMECHCPDTCTDETLVDCGVGFEKVTLTDICNCKQETCVPAPVCLITNELDQNVVKQQGETWVHHANPCLVCSCEYMEEDGSYQDSCVDNSALCTSCDQGYKEQEVKGECCPECVLDSCIVEDEDNVAYYNVDDEWNNPDDACETYTCDLVYDVPTITSHPFPCPPVDDGSLCQFGYAKKCDQVGCCIECTCQPEEICLHGHTALEPGSSKRINDCVEAFCSDVKGDDGFFKIETIDQEPSCEEGYAARPMPDQCCGECQPTFCNATVGGIDRVIQIGEDLKRNCIEHFCLDDGQGFPVYFSQETLCEEVDVDKCLENGGYVKYDADGCCPECVLTLKFCDSTYAVAQKYTVNGCTTDDAIELSYCSGQCDSGAHYHDGTGEFIQSCTCCQVLEYRNVTYPATCEDGMETFLTFRQIDSCSCEESLECHSWTRKEDFKSQSNDTNDYAIVTRWDTSNGPKMNVIEVKGSNADPSEFKDATEQVMSELGLLSLEGLTQIVKVNASGNHGGLFSAIRNGIDSAFSNLSPRLRSRIDRVKDE